MSGTRPRLRRGAGPHGVELRVTVRLTPRAGRDRIDGVVDGMLRARVAASPVDGAANESLIRLLAAELGVPPGAVRLITGAASRVKVIAIRDVDVERVRDRWPGLGSPRPGP